MNLAIFTIFLTYKGHIKYKNNYIDKRLQALSVSTISSLYTVTIAGFLTLYPEDLKWQPLLVSVLFILTQKARSIPRYSEPLAARLICDDTVNKNKKVKIEMHLDLLPHYDLSFFSQLYTHLASRQLIRRNNKKILQIKFEMRSTKILMFFWLKQPHIIPFLINSYVIRKRKK